VVKIKEVEVYVCEVCGEDFYFEDLARECERIHEEGIIVKNYLHRTGNYSETKEFLEESGYTLSDEQISMIYGLLYEVEIDIKVMDDSAEIVGIKKEKTTLEGM
jgi:hypothetical protein